MNRPLDTWPLLQTKFPADSIDKAVEIRIDHQRGEEFRSIVATLFVHQRHIAFRAIFEQTLILWRSALTPGIPPNASGEPTGRVPSEKEIRSAGLHASAPNYSRQPALARRIQINKMLL